MVTLYIVLSHSTVPLFMPHSCSGEVTAFLSTEGKQMVDNSPGEMSLTGRQHQELPTKSSPIQGLGREQWAKSRVSQFSFTQQLAENQQVGMLSTPHRQQEGNLATTRRRGTTCRQMIKIIREPINDGVIPNLFVGSGFCWSTCLTPSHFDLSASYYGGEFFFF